MVDNSPQQYREATLLVLDKIPAGKVATYGQVARLAGMVNGARRVGHLLATLPADSGIPWHRVVNAKGEISLAPGSAGHERQRRALEREGVVFEGKRLNLRRYRWTP